MATRTVSEARRPVRGYTKSLAFNGSNALATIPVALNVASFNVGAWVFLRAGIANGSMIFNWESAQERNGFFIKVDTSTRKFVAVLSGATGNEAIISATTQFVYGRWTHVALTYTPNSAKLYEDGVLQNTDTSVTVTTNVNSLTIGRDAYGATRFGSFLMNDLVLGTGNGVWSADDIFNLMRNRILPTDYRWSFDNAETDINGANAATLTNTSYNDENMGGGRAVVTTIP
jgi:hypothetical protein